MKESANVPPQKTQDPFSLLTGLSLSEDSAETFNDRFAEGYNGGNWYDLSRELNLGPLE